MPNGEDFKLSQDQENEILSIIYRMEKNGESESNIRYIVSEFKKKSLGNQDGTTEPTTTAEESASVSPSTSTEIPTVTGEQLEPTQQYDGVTKYEDPSADIIPNYAEVQSDSEASIDNFESTGKANIDETPGYSWGEEAVKVDEISTPVSVSQAPSDVTEKDEEKLESATKEVGELVSKTPTPEYRKKERMISRLSMQEKEAAERGMDVGKYRDYIESSVLAPKFLEGDDLEEYNLVNAVDDFRPLSNKEWQRITGGDEEAIERGKAQRKKLRDAAVDEYNQFTQERYAKIDEEISDLNSSLDLGLKQDVSYNSKGEKVYSTGDPLTEEDRKEIKQRLKDLNSYKSYFFKTPEEQAKVAYKEQGENIEKLEIPGDNAQEKFKNYYHALHEEWKDLDKKYSHEDKPELEKRLGYLADFWQGQTEIGLDEDEKRYWELTNLMTRYAPIALINKDKLKDESALDVLGKSFMTSYAPSTKQFLSTEQQTASSLKNSLSEAGIETKDLESASAEKLEETASPYEHFSGKDWAQMTGTTAAIVLPMAVGTGATNSIMGITRLGKAYNAISRSGNIERVINSSNAITRAMANSKVGRGIVKGLTTSAKTGLDYEAAGAIFGSQEDELTFLSGFIGGNAANLASGGLKGANKLVGKMSGLFGDKTDEVISAVTKFGGNYSLKKGAEMTGRGFGETAEEFGNELGNIIDETGFNDEVFDQLSQRFGDPSEAFHFAASTFMMGVMMGAGSNTVGNTYLKLSKKTYDNLSNEEKNNFEEYTKEAVNEIEEVTEKNISEEAPKREEDKPTVAEEPTERVEPSVEEVAPEELADILDEETATKIEEEVDAEMEKIEQEPTKEDFVEASEKAFDKEVKKDDYPDTEKGKELYDEARNRNRILAENRWTKKEKRKPGTKGSQAVEVKKDEVDERKKYIKEKIAEIKSNPIYRNIGVEEATLEREFGKEFDKKQEEEVTEEPTERIEEGLITDDNVKESQPEAIQSSSGFVYVRKPDGSYTDGDVTYGNLEEALQEERETTGDTNPIKEYKGERIDEIKEAFEEEFITEEDAIQEPSPKAVDVQEQAKPSEEVVEEDQKEVAPEAKEEVTEKTDEEVLVDSIEQAIDDIAKGNKTPAEAGAGKALNLLNKSNPEKFKEIQQKYKEAVQKQKANQETEEREMSNFARKASDKAYELAQKAEDAAKKIDPNMMLSSPLPITPRMVQTALRTVAKALRAGADLTVAIDKAVAELKTKFKKEDLDAVEDVDNELRAQVLNGVKKAYEKRTKKEAPKAKTKVQKQVETGKGAKKVTDSGVSKAFKPSDGGMRKPVEGKASKTSGKVTMSEYSALKKQIRDFNRGYREGARALKSEAKATESELKKQYKEKAKELKSKLKSIQSAIRKYANEALPKDLRKSEVTPIMTAIENASTPSDLLKAIDRIDAVVEKSLSNKLRNEINEKLKAKKYQEGKKTPKGKRITADDIRLISRLRNAAKNETPLNEVEQAELFNLYSDSVELTEKDVNRMYELMFRGANDQSLTSTELEQLRDTLDYIIEGGVEKKLAENKIKTEEANKRAADFENAVTAGEGVKGKLTTEAKKRRANAMKNFFKKFKEGFKGYMANNIGDLNFLTDFINKSDVRGALKWIPDGFRDGRTKMLSISQQKAKDVTNKLSELFGSRDKAINELNKVAIDGKFNLVEPIDGASSVDLVMTFDEAVKVYNWMKDPSLAPAFSKMGWGIEIRNAISKAVESNPEMKEFADWTVDEFYPKFYNEVNEVYRDVYGIDLPQNTKYTPVQRVLDLTTKGEVKGVLDSSYTNASSVFSNLMDRTKNDKALDYSGGNLEAMDTYTKDMSRFIGMEKHLRDVQKIFTNNKTNAKQAIIEQHGQAVYSALDGMLKDLQAGRHLKADDKTWDQIARGIRRRAIGTSLGANLTLFPKQLTSTLAYMGEEGVNMGEWNIEFARMLKDFGTALPSTKARKRLVEDLEAIMNHPDIIDRYDKGFDRDMALLAINKYNDIYSGKNKFNFISKGLSKGKQWENNILNMLMLPTIFGDRAAIVLGGLPVYRMEYKNQKKKGKSDAEAKEIALKKFRDTTLSSQQSSNIQDLSAPQRGNALAKLFTMYKTSPMQYFRKNAIAYTNIIRDAKRGKAPNTSDLKRILVYRVLLPQLFQIATQAGFDPEDEDDIAGLYRALILGNFNALPIIGDLAVWGYDKIIGGANFDFDISPVLSRVERSVKKMSKDPDKYLEVGSEEFLEMMFALSSLMTAIPFQNLKEKGYDTLQDFSSGEEMEWTKAVQKGLGYSDYVLDKRYDGQRKKWKD